MQQIVVDAGGLIGAANVASMVGTVPSLHALLPPINYQLTTTINF